MKRLPEGPIFSKDPVCPQFKKYIVTRYSPKLQANLTNVHSQKYAGFANDKVSHGQFTWKIFGLNFPVSQTIAISETGSGIQIVTRKKGASKHAVKTGFATQTIRNRSGGRRAAGVVAKLAKRGYRPDLRQVSIVFALYFLPLFPPRDPPGSHPSRLAEYNEPYFNCTI